MAEKAVTVRIEKVTPTMADKYLGTQERNRHLNEGRVAFWVDVIQRGEWKITNDCVAFDVAGNLINGQHRLAAIHLSGQTCPIGVMRNLPDETQDVMDSGLIRRTQDALAMRHERNAFNLAAGLRWEFRLRYIEENDRDSGAVHYAKPGDRPSTIQLLAVFEEDPEMWREMTSLGVGTARLFGSRSGIMIAALRRFWLASTTDAEGFHERLTTGANLKEGDPILQLRDVLSPQRKRQGRFERMADYRELAYICKAWNMWRDGDQRQRLTWHFGGTSREEFPIPR